MNPRRIEVLRGDVAKKIAAGEVIDRPFSVLRELLDNALDAGARNIEVRIEQGGTSLIQVRDDGAGMSKEDIQLCWHSHATSKIRHEDDLLTVSTLGFRGEALSSIAAVSKLEITSRTEESPAANRLTVQGGSSPRLIKVSADRGTSVAVRDIFFNLPARKKFIKSAGAETRLCRNVLLEKAAAHPQVEFRFFTDGQTRDLLPALGAHDFLQRIAQMYPAQCTVDLLREVRGAGEGFSFTCIIGVPPLHRSDRKFIHIHCNTRRISEFSLVHAVEYAMSDVLPGGTYPVGFVFLTIDPSEVDFNIHPAKREVRFSRPDILHRSLRQHIQNALNDIVSGEPQPFVEPRTLFTQRVDRESTESQRSFRDSLSDSHQAMRPFSGAVPDSAPDRAFNYHSQFDDAPEIRESIPGSVIDETGPDRSGSHDIPPYRYLGQVFSLFLMVEMKDSLYLIDMHAAHERILFERFKASGPSENLLIPLVMENDDPLLTGHRQFLAEELGSIGFEASADSAGNLEIRRVPSAFSGKERMLPGLIDELGSSVKDLETRLYENMACRTAVKDGDVLDRATARMIIEESWRLPVKRCPHGRPIWFTLTKSELFQLVGRVV